MSVFMQRLGLLWQVTGGSSYPMDLVAQGYVDNFSFEDATASPWTLVSATHGVSPGAFGQDGDNFLHGASTALGTATQRIDLLDFANEISEGGFKLAFGGRQLGTHTDGDTGALQIIFLDAGLTVLASPVTQTYPSMNPPAYTMRSENFIPPLTTRYADIIFRFIRVSGSVNNSAWDEATLILDQTSPEGGFSALKPASGGSPGGLITYYTSLYDPDTLFTYRRVG